MFTLALILALTYCAFRMTQPIMKVLDKQEVPVPAPFRAISTVLAANFLVIPLRLVALFGFTGRKISYKIGNPVFSRLLGNKVFGRLFTELLVTPTLVRRYS